MPFKSEAQKKYMWAKHPEIAKEWTKKYGNKIVPTKKKSPWLDIAKMQGEKK